ncbi:MAG: hypothetical protein MZV64_23665 [Ignavibacteriales bacterium]|nr:hypothetical protein [Ignavibacteriales bacterium]
MKRNPQVVLNACRLSLRPKRGGRTFGQGHLSLRSFRGWSPRPCRMYRRRSIRSSLFIWCTSCRMRG